MMSKIQKFRSVLTILAILFFTSSALRVSEYSGMVMATLSGTASATETAVNGETECFTDEGLQILLSEVLVRENNLLLREARIEEAESSISASITELEEKIAQLETTENNLIETIASATTVFEEDLEHLTRLYENMKPAEAAPLFEAMDPQFSAGFLSRMRTDVAAEIMEQLSPQSAYSISILMASRNANVPTE